MDRLKSFVSLGFLLVFEVRAAVHPSSARAPECAAWERDGWRRDTVRRCATLAGDPMHSWSYHEALGVFSVAWSALAQSTNRKRGCGTVGGALMGSRAHTSRAWEYGRNMLKNVPKYRRLADIFPRECA